MRKDSDLISRSHLLRRCEKLRDDAYARLKGVAFDSSLRTTLIIEKDERDRLCEMIREEPVAPAHNVFVAKRMYAGDKTLIIFAEDIFEAEKKAQKAFGLGKVFVDHIVQASCTDDAEVFEI